MPRMTHLLPVDAQLMSEFLDAFPTRYRVIEYDVHVGDGRDPGTEFNDNMRRMAMTLSQRRIDVVGFTPDHIDIIEVTQVAGLKALGQLTAYPRLFQYTHRPDLPLRPVLVAREYGTDAEQIFLDSNIETHIFPP